MTLVTITAPDSGPVATRYGDLIIPGTQIQYGGFASVLGFLSTDSKDTNHTKRDVYLFGAAENGLQVARVNLDDVPTYTQYSFWEPENLNFSSNPVAPKETDIRKIYLPGTFTSGSIFYSNSPINQITHEETTNILQARSFTHTSWYISTEWLIPHFTFDFSISMTH